MPQLKLAPAYSARGRVGLPTARLVNCFAETTPAGPNESARIPRPGMTLWHTLGTGPIYGIYGVSGNSTVGPGPFAVSANTWYKSTTVLGTVAGANGAVMASGGDQIALVVGGNLYVWNGTLFSHVTTFTDASALPNFLSVAFISERFVYTVKDTNVFYYSDVGDATSINPLSFATCETDGSDVQGVQRVGDELAFFKSASVEWWGLTGDPDAPFQLSPGRTYQRGCLSQGSVVKVDNSLVFVGEDAIVYRAGVVPQRISTSFIEGLLETATLSNVTAWAYPVEGHTFYVLNIPSQGTYQYDFQTQLWSELASNGQTNFLGAWATTVDGVTYVGSSTNGKVWSFDVTAVTDDGTAIERVVSAFAPLPSGIVRNSNVALQVRAVPTGGVPSPVAQMRYSDDEGATWTAWDTQTLVADTGRKAKVVWWRRGLMSSPGRNFEFRTTEAVAFTPEGMTFNARNP